MAAVEVDVAVKRSSRLVDAVIGLRHNSSYLTLRQKRSRNTTLSRHEPLPSMLIAIWCSTRTSVKARLGRR